MAEPLGRAIRRKEALQMIADHALLPDAIFEKEFGRRAFSLPDGALLMDLDDGRVWRLWFSKEAYIKALGQLKAKPSYDPVRDAVGDANVFLRERTSFVRELLGELGGMPERALETRLSEVDRLVRKHSGRYWTDDARRLRTLVAFVGEVLCERTGGSWAVDPTEGVAVQTANGRRLQIGATISGHADEAPRGSFSIEAVIDELTSRAREVAKADPKC